MRQTWSTAPARGPEATELLWEYLDEMVTRYYGRPATDSEIRYEVEETASDTLESPRGALLAAWCEGELAGCVGMRILEDGVALGARVMRVDTRSDLVEARVLYARLGYEEIPAYAPSPHAEHWFEKSLVA